MFKQQTLKLINQINSIRYYHNSNLINSIRYNLFNQSTKHSIRQLTYYERKLENELQKNKDELTDELLKSSKLTDELLKISPKSTTKLYETHQQLNTIQTILLAFGSSIGALIDPYRHDLVAISSETFIGKNALKNLLKKMRNDEEANRILIDRPRINSIEIDLDHLSKLPSNTLGYQYVKFLNDNNITCDTRKSVKYVDDADLAYVLQRYREVHDFTHLLFNMKTTILGEVIIKWIEAIQTEIPMCIGAAILGPIRLYPKQRELFKNYYLDWAIKNAKQSKLTLLIYYEERWEQDLNDLRKELNILPLPKIN